MQILLIVATIFPKNLNWTFFTSTLDCAVVSSRRVVVVHALQQSVAISSQGRREQGGKGAIPQYFGRNTKRKGLEILFAPSHGFSDIFLRPYFIRWTWMGDSKHSVWNLDILTKWNMSGSSHNGQSKKYIPIWKRFFSNVLWSLLVKVNPKFFLRNYGWGNHYPIQNHCPHGKLSMNLPDHLLYLFLT